MSHVERTVRRGLLLLIYLMCCVAAAHGQPPQKGDGRQRTIMGKWEKVYSEAGGINFKSVFSAPVRPGKTSSPRWLWAGDDKGFLRLTAYDPESNYLLGPPPVLPALSYLGLSKLEVAPNLIDMRVRGASVNAIYFDEQGDGYLLKGNRLFFTDNAGFTWRQLFEVPNLPDGTPATLFSIAVTDKGACMVGMFSQPDEVRESLVYCTEKRPTNPDARWERRKVEPQTQIFHIFFHGDRHGWAVGTQGTILRTTTGGREWHTIDFEAESLLQTYFVNEQDGWIVGRFGTILHTTNGGKEWSPEPVPFSAQLANVSLRSIKFSRDGLLGWIVGDQGTILHSSDGGDTWQMQPPLPPKDTRLEALFVDDDFCWAVGSGGAIWRQRLRQPQTRSHSYEPGQLRLSKRSQPARGE